MIQRKFFEYQIWASGETRPRKKTSVKRFSFRGVEGLRKYCLPLLLGDLK